MELWTFAVNSVITLILSQSIQILFSLALLRFKINFLQKFSFKLEKSLLTVNFFICLTWRYMQLKSHFTASLTEGSLLRPENLYKTYLNQNVLDAQKQIIDLVPKNSFWVWKTSFWMPQICKQSFWHSKAGFVIMYSSQIIAWPGVIFCFLTKSWSREPYLVKRHLNFVPLQLAKDLLHPLPEEEQRKCKLKRLVQHPNSFFMDVKCPGCYKITTVFSHAQTVVLCVGCSTVLCQPTGGKARLTEGMWNQERYQLRLVH